MLKICLTNKLVNPIVKKFLEGYFTKKFGITGSINIDKLIAEEMPNGHINLVVNLAVDLTPEDAETFINNL